MLNETEVKKALASSVQTEKKCDELLSTGCQRNEKC